MRRCESRPSNGLQGRTARIGPWGQLRRTPYAGDRVGHRLAPRITDRPSTLQARSIRSFVDATKGALNHPHFVKGARIETLEHLVVLHLDGPLLPVSIVRLAQVGTDPPYPPRKLVEPFLSLRTNHIVSRHLHVSRIIRHKTLRTQLSERWSFDLTWCDRPWRTRPLWWRVVDVVQTPEDSGALSGPVGTLALLRGARCAHRGQDIAAPARSRMGHDCTFRMSRATISGT